MTFCQFLTHCYLTGAAETHASQKRGILLGITAVASAVCGGTCNPVFHFLFLVLEYWALVQSLTHLECIRVPDPFNREWPRRSLDWKHLNWNIKE